MIKELTSVSTPRERVIVYRELAPLTGLELVTDAN